MAALSAMQDLIIKPNKSSQEEHVMDNHFEGTDIPDDYRQHYTEFIETAAHDLQAPLRKLAVLTERLVSKYPLADKEIEGYTSRINTCIRDMRTLIDDMAEMAAITPLSVEWTPCDTGTIISNILTEMNKLILEKNAQITVGNMPVIEGDKQQCRQLFKKLIRNALLFHENVSPPHIHINAARLSDEEKKQLDLEPGSKSFYRFEVSDDGMGFESGNAEKIFQPFVRLNGKSAFEGTGLGLTMCRRIAENHGGYLYAEGELNKGARFVIILPENHK